MAIAFMGIDLAKSVFQLHGADSEGRLMMSKRLRRDPLLPENHRSALVSQMRGLLLDRGVTIGVSISRARRAIPEIVADPGNGLTAMTREIIAEFYESPVR